MSECKCQSCASPPSPTYLSTFALSCEARLILSWPLQQRREYLAAKPVQGRRKELEAEMLRQHKERKP